MSYTDPAFDPDVIHVCARCGSGRQSEIAAYRCHHQPQNVYRDDQYIGVMFTAEDAAEVVAAMNERQAEDRREVERANERFMCGAYQPLGLAEQSLATPYRCTEPSSHDGPHEATVQGQAIATWSRL